jgi:hypothetical protein
MSNELHDCATSGNLESVKQLVEGGANLEETNENGMTSLSLASIYNHFEIVVYLIERKANVAHTDRGGFTALYWACVNGNLPTVKLLLEHGARVNELMNEGRTAFLEAAQNGSLEVVKYLLSSEGGASITETDNKGNTALLLAAGNRSGFFWWTVQWLLEYGGAQISDTNNEGDKVWSSNQVYGLLNLLKCAYKKGDDGEYVSIDGEYVPGRGVLTFSTVLRVMVLHGGPPASLTNDLAPPLQRIVQDGARLRARLPAYLTQRHALIDAHCPLLPPLRDIVHGYEEPTTTDELWATGLGTILQRAKRSRLERGHLSARRSARLRQKHE